MSQNSANVTIIVCYNDLEQVSLLKDCICSSEATVEFMPLDNREHAFPSAAKAYNYALQRISEKAEAIIFCHQDIRFSKRSIDLIADACLEEKDTLFGVAGARNEGRKNRGKTISTLVGEAANWSPAETGTYAPVFSLDECLIAGHRSVFERVSFDEKTCDGWHLYAVDLCIQCHLKCIDVKVMDAEVRHLSRGHVDRAFIRTEGKLAKKYRKDLKMITHTNGWTYTNPLKRVIVLIYRKIRYGAAE